MIFAVLKKKKILSVFCIILSIIFCFVLLEKTSYLQVFSAKNRQLPIYRVQREDKQISISFDCAWGTDYTDKLLEIMQKEEVKCTFFCVEFWSKKHPDYIKKIHDFGHEIGTHSATHPYMSKLSKEQIERELNSSMQAISSITNQKVEVFRPPYGDYNDLLINTAREMGLYIIQWDVDSLDWKDLSKDQIINRVIPRVKSGSIVLFHNQGLHTADALQEIIRRLKDDGYTFVPIGELIYKENFYMAPDGTQIANQ